MLILTRKLGEGIMIGSDVVVRVIEIKGGQVKLGIDAPHETSVHREEVYRRICKENGGSPPAPGKRSANDEAAVAELPEAQVKRRKAS